MAMTSLLLVGAAALLLLSGNKKEFKASDGKVFSSEKERDAYEVALAASKENADKTTEEKENAKAVADAAIAIKEAEEYYAKRVIVSDVTMQFFNDGKKFAGLAAEEFPYTYIVWAKFANMSDIPVNVVIDTVLVTLVHTTNSNPFPINHNNIIIPAHTETKWLPIVVAGEQVLRIKKYFDNDRLFFDIKENFPRQFNFFLPAHFYIKYNVEIPNQDTILAKDVIFEVNREALSLNTKGDSGWFGFSTDGKNIAGTTRFFAGNHFDWVLPVNRNSTYGKFHTSSVNMLDPDNNSAYRGYLDILRSANKTLRSTIKNKPIRYILLDDYNRGRDGQTSISYYPVSYDYSVYPAKMKHSNAKVKYPYMGIVYDEKGIVAYE